MNTLPSENPPKLKILLFGAMRVEADGVPLVRGVRKKELWLLAILALRPTQNITREYLAGLLWPDNPAELALFYLRRALSALRAGLGVHGDRLQVIKPRSLGLDTTELFVDVLEFARLASQGDVASLEAAVALYTAPVLEDCPEEWALTARTTHELLYQKALDTLAQEALEAGNWKDTIRYARLLIAADPLQEKAHRNLMQAQAQSGNHAAATQAYRDLRLRLREEINAEPDPESVALYEAIRQQARKQPAKLLTLPPPSPAPAALQLPPPLSRLIGREQDLRDTVAQLNSSRLVTLIATGGVGKTRLAIEVARTVADRYAEGAAFVEFASVTDPELAPRTLAQTLGIVEDAAVPVIDTICQALQASERLLVLDNCEHLLDACAQLAGRLIQSCPKLRIIATSRQPLGITGERILPVASLPVPPPEVLQEETFKNKANVSVILEYPAVQLFLERVHQTYPEFRLTPAKLPLIGQICRRLDGIPLALELAAYRVRAVSLEKILERLEDRFRLLTGGNRTALPRQQTLRALIDWSYHLLTSPEQRLFARLSVFVNGWTLEASEAICSDADIDLWDVMDLLASLVDKSLVVYDGQDRYRFLETIREYALEHLLESGEEERQRERHAAYFAALVAEAEPLLLGPEQATWLARLEQEQDNLRAALAWSRLHSHSRGTGLRIAGSLWRFWQICGYWQEALEHLNATLENIPEDLDQGDRGNVLNGIGAIAYRMGNFAQASIALRECIPLREALGDKKGGAGSLHNLGNVYWSQGDFEAARTCFEQSLAVHRELGIQHAQAYNLLGIGNIGLNTADLALARSAYLQARELFRTVGDRNGEILTLGNLGGVALQENDPDLAESYSLQALHLCYELNYQEGVVLQLGVLAAAAKQKQNYTLAHDYYARLIQTALDIGDKRVLITSLEGKASTWRAEGEYPMATRLYGCASIWHERIGMHRSNCDQEAYDQNVAELRSAMGETLFASCWQDGQSLSLEEATRLALSESLDA